MGRARQLFSGKEGLGGGGGRGDSLRDDRHVILEK